MNEPMQSSRNKRGLSQGNRYPARKRTKVLDLNVGSSSKPKTISKNKSSAPSKILKQSKISFANSSLADSGIDSPGSARSKRKLSRETTKVKTQKQTLIKKPKLDFSTDELNKENERLSLGNGLSSTPYNSRKLSVKDASSCFGFECSDLDDNFLSPTSNDRMASWLCSDEEDFNHEASMPDPGVSPIKEPKEYPEVKLIGNLFEEDLCPAPAEKLLSSAKTYTRRSSSCKKEKKVDVSGYESDEPSPANKSLTKNPKVKKFQKQAQVWEKNLMSEFDEIDKFELYIE